MAYTDPQFNVHYERGAVGSPNNGIAPSPGTATASGTNALTGVYVLPTFIRATVVSNIKVTATTAATNLTGSLIFLNGTNTLGSVAVTTLTSGESKNATITTANSTFTATDGKATVNFNGTSTASGHVLGTYAVAFEITELFS